MISEPEERKKEEDLGDARFLSELHSDRADIVEQQLNPSRTIAEVKATLLGTTFGQNKKKQWVVGIPNPEKRVFTDEGVNAVISYLEPILSSQVALSNLSEEDARRRAQAFEINIALNMTTNWNRWFSKKYIEQPSMIEPVHDRIKFTLGLLVYSHLTRAISGATHQGIVDMSKRIEHSQIIQREEMPQASGFMGKLRSIKMR